MQNEQLNSRDDLIREHYSWVKSIVNEIASKLPPYVERNELLSAAHLGLLEAAERFSLAKGVAFRSYAEKRVRGAVLDLLRSNDWLPRNIRSKEKKVQKAINLVETTISSSATYEDIACVMGISLEELEGLLCDINSFSVVSLDQLVECDDGTHVNLHGCLGNRDADSYEILEKEALYEYVSCCVEMLDGNWARVIKLYYFENKKLKEIGDILQLTESRISQLRGEAEDKLKAIYKNNFGIFSEEKEGCMSDGVVSSELLVENKQLREKNKALERKILELEKQNKLLRNNFQEVEVLKETLRIAEANERIQLVLSESLSSDAISLQQQVLVGRRDIYRPTNT